MTAIKRVFAACCAFLLFAAPLLAAQATAGQSEFVPISELPPAEQMPAAPLLIAAYAFVWVALLAYLWSIWRRLGRVDADIQALERRAAQRSPAR